MRLCMLFLRNYSSIVKLTTLENIRKIHWVDEIRTETDIVKLYLWLGPRTHQREMTTTTRKKEMEWFKEEGDEENWKKRCREVDYFFDFDLYFEIN